MKKTSLLIAMILCLLTMAACDGSKTNAPSNTQPPTTTQASTESADSAADAGTTGTSDSTGAQDTTESGMRRVEYTCDAIIYNFDWGDQRGINDLSIAIDIPDYFANSDLSYIFHRYDKELDMALPALEISTTFEVDGDFVMDETVHSKTKCDGTWQSLEGWDVITGKTASGYDYVIYEAKDNDLYGSNGEKEYCARVYVRLSDKYIVSLEYRDLMENYRYMAESIDSIKLLSAPDGSLQHIEYTFDEVMCNFSYGDMQKVDDLTIAVDIPNYLRPASGIDNPAEYYRLNPENDYTIRDFEIVAALKVDADFVMDETIHDKTECGGTWPTLENCDVLTGKTTSGYDYVLYEDASDGCFIYVYVRLTDNYIVVLNYADEADKIELNRESFNSVRLVG